MRGFGATVREHRQTGAGRTAVEQQIVGDDRALHLIAEFRQTLQAAG